MDELQAYRQIKETLEDAVWPDSSNVVFPSVIISSGPVETAFRNSLRLPCAIIVPGTATADPDFRNDSPGVLRADFVIRLYSVVHGDDTGERALLGANRTAEDESEGMGLLELQRRLYAELEDLGPSDGIEVNAYSRGPSIGESFEGLGYIVTRDYGFMADVDTQPEYPPAVDLVGTPSGGTQIAWSWKQPADRFDRLSTVIMRYAAGSTAPATATDGVGLTPDTAISHLQTGLSSGDHSVSVFQGYDERTDPPDTNDHISAAVSRTVNIP